MAGEFRGLVVTQTTMSSPTGSDVINVQMPADIQAGDFLFIMVGGPFNLRVLDHEIPNGTWTNIGVGADHARIADGSEAGASIPFANYPNGFSGTRPVTAIALCYRFPYTALNIGGLYLGGTLAEIGNGNHIYSGSLPLDSLDHGGSFGGAPGVGRSEFRIYHVEAETNDTLLAYNPSSAVWSGDLITDRTGLIGAVGGTYPDGIDAGGNSVADAFYLSIPDTGTSTGTGVVIDGPGTDGGARLKGWVIGFPLIVVQDYWGILNP